MWTVAELRFPLVIKITVGATTLQAWEEDSMFDGKMRHFQETTTVSL